MRGCARISFQDRVGIESSLSKVMAREPTGLGLLAPIQYRPFWMVCYPPILMGSPGRKEVDMWDPVWGMKLKFRSQ